MYKHYFCESYIEFAEMYFHWRIYITLLSVQVCINIPPHSFSPYPQVKCFRILFCYCTHTRNAFKCLGCEWSSRNGLGECTLRSNPQTPNKTKRDENVKRKFVSKANNNVVAKNNQNFAFAICGHGFHIAFTS